MPHDQDITEVYKKKVEALLQRYTSDNATGMFIKKVTQSIAHNPLSTFYLFKSRVNEALCKSHEKTILALAPELKDNEAAIKKIMSLITTSELMQTLLGKPIHIPKTVTHLCILYWLTDEILDNKAFSINTKKIFSGAMKELIANKGKLFMVNFKEEPLETAERITNDLRLIQRHIQAFFSLTNFRDNAHEMRIMHALITLNLVQNKCALVQSLQFYQETIKNSDDTAIPNAADITAHAKLKGAMSFELYALLLSPDITEDQLALMHKLGELYQLSDDIHDLLEDIQSEIITPAVISLLKTDILEATSQNQIPPKTETPPLSHRDFLALIRSAFEMMKSRIPTYNNEALPTYLDMASFYAHCYDVLEQIQKTFLPLKQNVKGVRLAILTGLEYKMVLDISAGINSVISHFTQHPSSKNTPSR